MFYVLVVLASRPYGCGKFIIMKDDGFLAGGRLKYLQELIDGEVDYLHSLSYDTSDRLRSVYSDEIPDTVELRSSVQRACLAGGACLDTHRFRPFIARLFDLVQDPDRFLPLLLAETQLPAADDGITSSIWVLG